MLKYAHHPPGFRRDGSASVTSRAAVRAWRIASGSGQGIGRNAGQCAPVVPCLAGPRPNRAQGGRPRGPQAAVECRAVGRGRAGHPRGTGGARLPDGSVDAAARGRGNRAAHWRPAPPWPRLARAAPPRMVPAAAGAAGPRTRRTGDHDLEDAPMGAAKKNASRRHAWLVFEDESGLSQQPVVRRTWAPRGETPVLKPVGRNWKRLSIAGALAFRWDGRRTRFFFQTRPGTFTDRPLIAFLRALKRHLRGRPVMLIWDGLHAHRSAAMRQYVQRQRGWLTVERLPGYAPELNPVELVWGNIKHRELANLCVSDLDALRSPLRRGCARVRRNADLAQQFLRHTGLRFEHGR